MPFIKKLKFLTYAILLIAPLACFSIQNTITIMLDPAGDAKKSGRTIDNTVERALTLEFTETLQITLRERFTSVRIIPTRVAGETIEPLQNANFANRLGANLYLSIHFYQTKKIKPELTIYRFSRNDFSIKINPVSFYRYDQAHLHHFATTQNWCTMIHNTLNNDQNQKLFDCLGVFAVPFKPLIGINVPAIGLEMGLRTRDDINLFLEPIVQSLSPIITALIQKNRQP